MIPELPSNPWTITPVKMPPDMELKRLRQMDTLERTTTPEREAKKAELEEQLKLTTFKTVV